MEVPALPSQVTQLPQSSKETLYERAAEIARALLGHENVAMSSKRELRFGRKGSLAIVVAGQKIGVWYDHQAGEGGDLVDLIRRERRLGFKEALSFASQFAGHSPRRFLPTRKPGCVAPPDAERLRKNSQDARHLWDSSIDLRGTPAERYLVSRGFCALPHNLDEVLRFHPRGHFGGTRMPMLVGLYRDIVTDGACGIHRTALTACGEKIGRRYLGRKAGAAIKLTANEDVEQGLTIGEGIETTLSAMLVGLTPAWALGDAGALGSFPVLAGIDCLTILVDHDEAGEKQASKCRQRWLAAGREVIEVIPNHIGDDLNDLLRANA